MSGPITKYKYSIDTHNHQYSLVLYSSNGEIIETMVSEDLDRGLFMAMLDICRYERPLAFDIKTRRLGTAEHEPMGEGEDKSPGADHTPHLGGGQSDDADVMEPNSSVFRHVNQYKPEIDVQNKTYRIVLYLDGNRRGRINTDCVALYSLLLDTLRNHGNRMIWRDDIGVLSSEVLCVGAPPQSGLN